MPRLPGPLMRLLSSTMFRIFRYRRFMGFPVLLLTTIGARTGQLRRTVVGYFSDPADSDAWIIVASAAGAAKHPAWYFNLARHPEQVWIEVGSTKRRVRPELLVGTERAAAWQRLVAEAPAYAGYATKTDREIPLVRLKPADVAGAA
jgi:deazaflavin-dependent oxidoreductase (nitroreductase family)